MALDLVTLSLTKKKIKEGLEKSELPQLDSGETGTSIKAIDGKWEKVGGIVNIDCRTYSTKEIPEGDTGVTETIVLEDSKTYYITFAGSKNITTGFSQINTLIIDVSNVSAAEIVFSTDNISTYYNSGFSLEFTGINNYKGEAPSSLAYWQKWEFIVVDDSLTGIKWG